MVISVLQLIIQLPEATSLKEKRHEIKSLKEKMIRKFKLSVAEVDLLDSIAFAHLGAVIVSNSRQFGESVLQKAAHFAEKHVVGRLADIQIFSERYD